MIAEHVLGYKCFDRPCGRAKVTGGGPDWQVAYEAEVGMNRPDELAEGLSLFSDEVITFGRGVGKVDFSQVIRRLPDRGRGTYVDVETGRGTGLFETRSIMWVERGGDHACDFFEWEEAFCDDSGRTDRACRQPA
ncbi:MAG: hypothetical protein J7M25_15400 [Deltaproteobacteria bacterium]|nr:hypothetical protein [Deltaproteobacteria bacterium]